ncbi:MAG TPA: OmpH family outer membrane protein [Lacipirellulaceae bacterium]|nr:OmpH family outer membrane protein [Lacipirellulaceae bacterium]
MRKLLASVAVSCSIALGSVAAQAQQAAPAGAAPAFGANAGRFGVAVVDISYIFKNYKGFTDAIEKLKVDMTAADGQLKAASDALVALQQKRDLLKPGSDQFKQIDEDLARQKAEFTIKQGTVRRDFLEREAQIYYSTYTQVSEVVRQVASQNNIGMVLRFNGDPIDPTQREDVMRAIMQPIVFQNNVDITPDVIALLGRQGGAATTNARQPGAMAPR